MSEAAYFEQFSGYQPGDDAWQDVFTVMHGEYAHREFTSKVEAEEECRRLSRKYPERRFEFEIVVTPNALCGGRRFKMLDARFFPLPLE